MKDVALEAGVALGTVSKVINGVPVGDSYRRKVEEAIKKLNYQVNSYAQGLKAHRTNTVAFLVPNTTNPYFATLTHYVNLSLMKRNYRMLLCCTDFNPALEQDYVSMVHKNQVDGIIGMTYNPDLIVDENTPFVSIDRCLSPQIPCISSDNFAGGQLAAEKLADLGCTHVAFMRIGSSLTNEPNKRKAGFENGCLMRGLTFESLLLDDGTPLEAFTDFLREHVRNGRMEFDGIFCGTDYYAVQVRNSLAELGFSVPGDVQLIGFDGVRMFPDSPLLCSTIVQPVEDIAQLCVDFVLQEGMATKPPLICLPVRYEAGGTTREETDS